MKVLDKFIVRKTSNIILESMKNNIEKIKQIDILIKDANHSDINEEKFKLLKNYILWSNKELLLMYDSYEKILNKTKQEIEKL